MLLNVNWRSVAITSHFIEVCKNMIDYWLLHNTSPKKYQYTYTPDDRISLVVNDNKAIITINLGNKNNADYV